MRKKSNHYWQVQPPTLASMVIDANIDRYDEFERTEILSHLPDYEGKKVLELGCGIGRFTGALASKASHLVTVDVAPHLLEKNKATHKHHSNITYTSADAILLDYPKGSFDFIFINWLFLYVTDSELYAYFQKLQDWLKPDGYLYFRESTFTDVRDYESDYYWAIFRFHFEYEILAKKYFSVIRSGLVLTYIQYRNITNQYYWLCQKKNA